MRTLPSLALSEIRLQFLPSNYLRFQLCCSGLNPLFHVPIGVAEFSLRLFSRQVFLCFRKGSPDGRHQPLLEPGFQNIVLSPLGEDFDGPVFSNSSGYKNKRCVGTSSSRLGKSQRAGVFGKVIVGEDKIRGAFLKFLKVIFFSHYDFRSKGEPTLLELELNQLCINRIIFQNKDLKGFCHYLI